MKPEKLILADALTLFLKDLNTKFIFGVSGANIEHLHDSIYRLGDNKLSAILAKSEFSASFMADGYARTHNTLGVCCSTSGGAMVNLAVGIAESYADNVPVLAIIGQSPTFLEGKGAFQDCSGKTNTLDGLSFWQSITKYAVKITRPEQFWDSVEQALKSAFHKIPGPTALLIPRDLFEAEVHQRPNHLSTNLIDYRAIHPHKSSSILALRKLLQQAQKPLMIVGKYAKYYQAAERIKNFAHTFNCMVVTTLADVNAFAHNHPLYLGMVGICGHLKAHDFIKDDADLIIVVEDDCSVMTTTGVMSSLNNTPLVYLGTDSTKACAAVQVDLAIEGDIQLILDQVLADYSGPALAKYVQVSTPMENHIQANSHLLTDKQHGNAGLSVSNAIESLAKFLPNVNQVLFDAGNCVAATSHFLNFPAHIKTVIALGMGGMGYAIPAAIGAQLGNNAAQKSMVFTGDGGFLITGLEIQTAVEYNLPVLFIIFNNNMHGMCVTRQQLYFDKRITASSYGKIHIADLVKGLGSQENLWSSCVEDILSLESSLHDYYTHHSCKTGVLEIKVTIEELPPFIPFLVAKGEMQVDNNKMLQNV
ncbi:thiamine pyrophosphate protein domain protein TPP-binding [Candidatus Amoebophilus asiaticus 5a2]|uniref:Thiamine pyrophosphate protein domain protein TPP-binding n=1 Tax=Amoebophilus asiaticus (strain 5a2) TaxID=452471 RepID=B3EUE3_AMOA5|nr:thiamine pyrophosphate-binding protein [Candidatus Amoebophilus asiaticus]ACE05562.1 thiamine pyrophosphate protein domain protein TPP-binding [Candidatus Amoebophilus asiaticus 5a2]